MFLMLCNLYVILKQELMNSGGKKGLNTELQETRMKNVKYVQMCMTCMHYHLTCSYHLPLLDWGSGRRGNLLNAKKKYIL